jgi:hypothetical protein
MEFLDDSQSMDIPKPAAPAAPSPLAPVREAEEMASVEQEQGETLEVPTDVYVNITVRGVPQELAGDGQFFVDLLIMDPETREFNYSASTESQAVAEHGEEVAFSSPLRVQFEPSSSQKMRLEVYSEHGEEQRKCGQVTN